MQKLVTTAAALDRLGPEARFETAVLADGPIAEGVLDGDLYLRGSGDPSFGTAALRRLAEKVGETGLEQVGGRIYGDESFFDRRRGGSGFGISPYVGPLSALAFNRGSMLPLARGWQSDPATLRGRADARHAAIGAGRRGPARRAPAARLPTRPRWPRPSRRRSRHSSGTRTTSPTTTTRRCC